MIYSNIRDIKPGMLLGKDILDPETNRVLLKSGVPLSEKFIDILKNKGYKGVYINTGKYEDIVVDDIISEELKNDTVKSIKNMDVERTIDNAKAIVEELIGNNDIFFDYHSILDDEYEHIVKITEMSIVVGNALGLNQKQLESLATASLLHNIGKSAKDPLIANKVKLNVPIYNEELYPLYGYEILNRIPDTKEKSTIKLGVLTHSMDEDQGDNFSFIVNQNRPKPIKQSDFGKIIKIAKSFEDVISKSYNDKLATPNEATEYLLGGCDTKFNRKIVEKFLEYIPIYPKGTEILLSNGIEGAVYKNNKKLPLRPVILLENGQIMDLSNPQYNNITIINITNQNVNTNSQVK